MADTSLTISVVVPVYNSAATLRELVGRLSAVLGGRCDAYEILLVNDGSRDGSWKEIQALAAREPVVRGIDMMRNYGQHNALLAGIREARHQIIVTIDDDLQNPPEEIPRLLEKLSEGYDVVYGWPRGLHHGFLRNVASLTTKIVLQKAMGSETARQISAYRAFRTSLREAFAGYQGTFVSIDVLLTWGTTRFTAVPVDHAARAVGESNYTIYKLLTHAANMITGFSILPLQAASMVGFCLAVLGGALFMFVIGRYLVQGTSVPGFTFLASIIAIFSGAQMLMIGILGEYLARIHSRTLNKPSYVVARRSGKAQGDGVASAMEPTKASSPVSTLV